MTDKKQCKNCIYNRPINPMYSASIKCCHFILDNPTPRKISGNVCMSQLDGEYKTKKPKIALKNCR